MRLRSFLLIGAPFRLRSDPTRHPARSSGATAEACLRARNVRRRLVAEAGASPRSPTQQQQEGDEQGANKAARAARARPGDQRKKRQQKQQEVMTTNKGR